MKQLGLLIRLIIGIIAGILIGMCGQWFGIADTAFFVTIIRLLATFTSLFSTFLSFMIPLIILSFITVGMAELGKKANRLFGLTLLLAYGTTVISGLLTFFIGKAVLPGLIQPITGDVLESNAFEPLFTITVDPIFGVMTALVFAFVLGIGMANLKGDSLLNVFRDLQKIVTGVLSRIIIPLIPIHIAVCSPTSQPRAVWRLPSRCSLPCMPLLLCCSCCTSCLSLVWQALSAARTTSKA